jgi:hypothetical protein
VRGFSYSIYILYALSERLSNLFIKKGSPDPTLQRSGATASDRLHSPQRRFGCRKVPPRYKNRFDTALAPLARRAII